jgi:hypothetical protein
VPDIAERYNQNPQREWERLTRSPYHTLEFLMNLHQITAHLLPGARVQGVVTGDVADL